MPRTFIFDQDFGVQIQDSRSKSVLDATTAYTDDLTGCGDQTHMRLNASGNLNWSPSCEVGLQPYLSLSTRSVSKLDPVVSNSGSTVNPVDLEEILDNLINYVADRAYGTNVLGDPNQFLALSWKIQGRSHVASAADISYTLTAPRMETSFDQCGIQTGYRVSASITASVLKEFCIPELYFAMSVNALFGNKPTANGPFLTEAAAVAGIGLLADTFTLPAAPALSARATLALDTITAWRAANEVPRELIINDSFV